MYSQDTKRKTPGHVPIRCVKTSDEVTDLKLEEKLQYMGLGMAANFWLTVPAGGEWGANYKVQNEKAAVGLEFYTQQKYLPSSTMQISAIHKLHACISSRPSAQGNKAESNQARQLAPAEGNYNLRQKSWPSQKNKEHVEWQRHERQETRKNIF